MNKLQVIEQRQVLNKDFKVYGDFESPLFLAKDVAEWIDYDLSSVNKMLNSVDEEEKALGTIFREDGSSHKQWFLTEEGLYEVLMQSRKSIAKVFKKEVKSILKEIRKTGSYTRPKTTMELIELEFKAIKEVDNKIEVVKQELEEFKQDMPLLALEIEYITRARNRTAVTLLGGKESQAYQNKSLRGKVYADLSREIKRQFGVDTYKAIKRSDCQKVVSIIENYTLPLCLEDEVNQVNCEDLQLAI